MRLFGTVLMVLSALLLLNVYIAYSQETKTVDVNNDGAPDVVYYQDGDYTGKVEADTNYDGKPDITINLKDGKFESAEADSDYNGTPDQKFGNQDDFAKWLNKANPDFNSKLDKTDWRWEKIF